jgi:hypothetical protein
MLSADRIGDREPDPKLVARHALELLGAWVTIQMETVDELTAEARHKLSTLPNQRVLWELFGEWLIELRALEHQVASLTKTVDELKKGRSS